MRSHHFVEQSYGGVQKRDPVKQREVDVDKMRKYKHACGGTCSFVRQRAECIYAFARRRRGYDAHAWYRAALGVVGHFARSGRSCMVYAEEKDDWYAEHVKLMPGFLCVPLSTSPFSILNPQ